MYKRKLNVPAQLMEKSVLYVDMDGTLVTWRRAATAEQLLEKGYFRNMDPYWSVLEAVRMLNYNGVPVCVLSAYMTESLYALDEKNAWLDEFFPELDEDRRIFTPCYTSKYKAASEGVEPGSTLLLLDDYSVNLHNWKENGGVGIKLMNGINGTRQTWTGHKVSRFVEAQVLAEQIVRIAEKEVMQ